MIYCLILVFEVLYFLTCSFLCLSVFAVVLLVILTEPNSVITSTTTYQMFKKPVTPKNYIAYIYLQALKTGFCGSLSTVSSMIKDAVTRYNQPVSVWCNEDGINFKKEKIVRQNSVIYIILSLLVCCSIGFFGVKNKMMIV